MSCKNIQILFHFELVNKIIFVQVNSFVFAQVNLLIFCLVVRFHFFV